MNVTDELLAELEHRHMSDPKGAIPVFCSDITALTAELRRLRAENAELAQSLAESRANDQAAMGWLTSLRWASGDRGERMLPELVTHKGNQHMTEFYTLETLAARLNRSVVGVRTRLRASGRLPHGQYTHAKGSPLMFPVAEIEALIAADPSLVLPAKECGQ